MSLFSWQSFYVRRFVSAVLSKRSGSRVITVLSSLSGEKTGREEANEVANLALDFLCHC
jgi:hypothetical protein